jgi:zinc finger CCHC domain-containing protein 8
VVDDEDKPSGITIFGDDEVKLDYEGELPEQSEQSLPLKRMTVEFPGINAPIPENGDRWLWGSTPPHSSGHHSSESREYHDRGPPGMDHYSSRYHSYDYGPQSPGLGRSHSDRRRSPSRYENLPADDGAWAPHSYPRQEVLEPLQCELGHVIASFQGQALPSPQVNKKYS